MIELVIVSDSHGKTELLSQIKLRHPKAKYFIHCGDSELLANHPAVEGYEIVCGNCDWESKYLEEKVLTLTDSKTLFFTHGHRYDVNRQLNRLYYRARELDAQIVCFGHTHCIGAEVVDNILMMNPGSVHAPRNMSKPTYATLQLDNDDVTIRFLEADTGQTLKEITLNLNS